MGDKQALVGQIHSVDCPPSAPRAIGSPFEAFSRTLLARVPTLDPAKGLVPLHSQQEEKI